MKSTSVLFRRLQLAALVLILAAILVACGGRGESASTTMVEPTDPPPTVAPEPTATAEPTAEPEPIEAESSQPDSPLDQPISPLNQPLSPLAQPESPLDQPDSPLAEPGD